MNIIKNLLNKSKLAILALLTLCSVSSCQHIDGLDELTSSTTTETTQVKTGRDIQFVCKGLEVDYGIKSKATLASESITDLYVFEGTTLLKHQVNTDEDFGNPTVNLTIGAHDLTFIASKATGQSFENGIWSCTKVADTYGTVLSYTVSSSSSSKQVELTRVNGKIQWTVEDIIPDGATTVSFSIPQCYGLDKDLNGVSANAYQINNHAITSHSAGYSIGTMIIPANHADGSTISPTISFNNGTSYTTECTLKANTVTNIHGKFFSNDGSAPTSVNTTWNDTISCKIQ